MALYFFDTSALVKRYVAEVGTNWVQAITDPQAQHKIYIAEITGVEVMAAIARRVLTKSIAKADATTAIAKFRHDFTNQYRVFELTGNTIPDAMNLTENHQLRAYDAMQLAIALEIDSQPKAQNMVVVGVPALTIISADDELNTAATAEGLIIENPRNYP